MSNFNVHYEESDRASLRSKVLIKLREGILAGEYKYNDELKELTISKELGVSRTPVREAIHQLEREGLVKLIPNRGAYVAGISKKDIMDIYEVRSLLEGLCARWATVNITQKQIEELEEITFLSEFHANKGKFEQVYETDNRFHEIIYEASNSRILEHTLLDYHDYVQRVRKSSLSDKERAIRANEEHKDIIEALKAKDADKAEILANQHIKLALQYLQIANL